MLDILQSAIHLLVDMSVSDLNETTKTSENWGAEMHTVDLTFVELKRKINPLHSLLNYSEFSSYTVFLY